MDIDVLIDHLVNGELANLPVSDQTVSTNQAKLYSYINRGLAELNKEFQINQTEKVIKLKPSVHRYYINDKKLIMLLAAFDNEANELDINNEAKPTESVFTPSLGIVDWYGENLSATEEDFISLVYLRGFDDITSGNGIVNVSEGLLEPLSNYVGYCANLAVDSGERNPANLHYQRYINSIQMAKNMGIGGDTNTFVIQKFVDRGFV